MGDVSVPATRRAAPPAPAGAGGPGPGGDGSGRTAGGHRPGRPLREVGG